MATIAVISLCVGRIWAQNMIDHTEFDVIINGNSAGGYSTELFESSATGLTYEVATTRFTVPGANLNLTETTYYDLNKVPLKIEYNSEMTLDSLADIKAGYSKLSQENQHAIDAVDVRVTNVAIFKNGYITPDYKAYNVFGISKSQSAPLKIPDSYAEGVLFSNSGNLKLLKMVGKNVQCYDASLNKLVTASIKSRDPVMYLGLSLIDLTVIYNGDSLHVYINENDGKMYYGVMKTVDTITEFKLKKI